MSLIVDCRRIKRLLNAIVGMLVAFHVVTQGLYVYGGHNHQLGLRRLLDLGQEANLPTWYSSASLLLCASLLYLIGHAKRHERDRFARHWLALSGIFLFLAIDEGASVHEISINLLDPLMARFGHFDGYLLYAWVVPWGIFALVVGLSYLRFLGALTPDFRRRFVLADTFFVLGAAGTEMLEGHVDFLTGSTDASIPIRTVQEVAELLGVLIFARALLDYAIRDVGKIEMSFVERRPPD